MARAGHRSGSRNPSHPVAPVEAVNARGVFDAFDAFDAVGSHDDEATLQYRPAPRRAIARHASNFPPPIHAAAPARRPAGREARTEIAPPAPPARVSGPLLFDLESAAPAPRTVIVATESTPAMALDMDSGEYMRSTPTIPVPRPGARPSVLPFAAAGLLALAAGALVVLLTGGRAPQALAPAHAPRAEAPHAAARPAAVAPVREAAPAELVQPTELAVAQPSARPVAQPTPVRAAHVAAPATPVAKPAAPVVVVTKPVAAKPVAPEPKPTKAPKGAADDEVAKAKADANAAAATLGDSL